MESGHPCWAWWWRGGEESGILRGGQERVRFPAKRSKVGAPQRRCTLLFFSLLYSKLLSDRLPSAESIASKEKLVTGSHRTRE